MEETELKPVRWYRLTMGHGQNFKQSLLDWARKRDVTLGWVQCLGELKNASTVSGYRDENDPDSEKFVEEFPTNRHVMGQGTIIRDDDGERVHIHGPMGRKDETATGCWAGEPDTFRGMDLLVTVLKEDSD